MTAAPTWTSRSRWLARALLVLTGLLAGACALGIAEALVRARLDVYACDPALGWVFEAGSTGVKWDRHGEFSQELRFNALGFNDRERSPEKPAGTFRIVLLGDSVAAALQVPRERAFPALLEARLAEGLPAGRSVEVINAGVDGFGTGQELLLLRERALAWSPDVVLLQVFLYNDLADNAHDAGNWNHHLANRCGRPYFALRDGRLEALGPPEAPRSPKLLDRLLRHSVVYANFASLPEAPGAAPAFRNPDLFAEIQPPGLERAWRVTEALLLEVRDEVERRGARLVVVSVPMKRIVGQRTAAGDGDDLPQERLERSEARLREVLRRGGIDFVDLVSPLREFFTQSGRPAYFLRDSHLNEGGHAVVADAIHAWLLGRCAELRLPHPGCERS